MVAPTELLAEQHYAALEVIAEQLPLPLRPRVALLTGDLRTGSKVGGRLLDVRAETRVKCVTCSDAVPCLPQLIPA